jgi:hypothetical protein
MKNPKAKGSGFERKVGEKISLWLSHGERRDLLCRTVGSGAQFTSAFNRGQQAGLAGDLRAQDSSIAFEFFSIFVVECKFWRDLQLVQFVQKSGDLFKAMNKVESEADQVNKSWWLVSKQNRAKELLFMPARSFSSTWEEKLNSHMLFNKTIYMFILDEFFLKVDPEFYINHQQTL